MTSAAATVGTATADAVAPALEFDEVGVAYRVRGVDRPVLRGLSLTVGAGEAYGLVGESGCGKSTVALAALRALPRNGRLTAGSIRIGGRDLGALSAPDVRRLRATSVSIVYQNPGAALNPSIRIGAQVAESFEVLGCPRGEARERTVEMLRRVRIADADRVVRRYPHQLSGGMQQRVVIAMALAKDPALLVLDEPTTGLDATVEAEILDLVAALRAELGTSILFISHDLGVIGRTCDRVGVLYAGRLAEEGVARDVLAAPRHPYAVGLLRCLPREGMRKDRGRLDTIPGVPPPLGADLPGCVFADRCGLVEDVCRRDEPPFHPVGRLHRSRCHFHERAHELPPAPDGGAAGQSAAAPEAAGQSAAAGEAPVVVRAERLRKTFRQDGHLFRTVDEVSFAVRRGETLGLVGESGSGKTTIGRLLLGLTAPDDGSLLELDGAALPARLEARDREQVRALQVVFQSPDAALNRRFSARRTLARSLRKLDPAPPDERARRLRDLVEAVRLDPRLLAVRPPQLSGGMKQRVAIARAFAGEPRLVVCDEPTSALDVSVQAAILNLLADLQRERGVAYLFISHDLGVVRYLADRIAVLYLGRVLEIGDAEAVLSPPHHPYTEALLSAAATLDDERRRRIRLEGELPSAAEPPSGCVFHTRCPRKLGEICEREEPPLAEAEDGHFLRCHIPLPELRRLQASPPPSRPAVER